MESLKDLNKMISDFEKISKRNINEANLAINKLPKEQRSKFKNLLSKAKSGKLSVEQLMKEVNG